MKPNIFMIEEFTEKGLKSVPNAKDLPSGLKGRLVILSPENSEIAKNLEITGKGVYSTKRR